MCNEAIHEARTLGKDYILLQLDFRKAFDSVNWRFLRETLKAYNFGETFQNYIKAILVTAASAILINGRRSRPVNVTRSVWQGCPLSPLLFILVTQTLTATLENEVQTGRIQGIYLQKANIHHCLGFYADDSHVIIAANEKCAKQTRRKLDGFANASGLNIQWGESAARWIGPMREDKPDWVTELAWSWKEPGEETKLLGFAFEEGIQGATMLRKCQQKIQEAAVDGKIKRVHSLATRQLWEEGYRVLGDLTDETGEQVASWANRRIKGTDRKNVQTAFTKLTSLIVPPDNAIDQEERRIQQFFAAEQGRGEIRRWAVKGKDKRKDQKPPVKDEETSRFVETNNQLVHCKAAEEPDKTATYTPIEVVEFRVGQGKRSDSEQSGCMKAQRS
ncbi:hypothetical protein R1sor_021515 [Riccia sorocarpa]|uniref:Reverse transcriptase domain-containing protein n=1 Tax=Riccia sorocarpa TaxID=122646 RepID=A0ABD3GMZ8_9MARC